MRLSELTYNILNLVIEKNGTIYNIVDLSKDPCEIWNITEEKIEHFSREEVLSWEI